MGVMHRHEEGSESQQLGEATAFDNVDTRACSLLTTNPNKMHPKGVRTVFLRDVQGVEES